MTRAFVVTTFHTGEPYLTAALMLKESCEKQGVLCIVKEVPPLSEDKPRGIALGRHRPTKKGIHKFPNELWHTKGRIVLEAMEETKLPVWWVDADALLINGELLINDTNYMIEHKIDFACHMYLTTNRKFSDVRYQGRLRWPAGGGMFFNHTIAATELIGHWDEMHKEFPDEDDQMTIERAMKATYYLTFMNLPIAYHQQFDDPHGEGLTPVFKQMQIRRNQGYLQDATLKKELHHGRQSSITNH